MNEKGSILPYQTRDVHSGRKSRIRTGDLLVPNQARYHLRHFPMRFRNINQMKEFSKDFTFVVVGLGG